MENKRKKEIQDAIAHFSDGEFAPDAVEQVHKWLLLRKDYDLKKEAWESVWAATEAREEDLSASLAGTWRKAAAAALHRQESLSRRRKIFSRIAAAAAVVLLGVLVSAVTFNLTEKQIRRNNLLTTINAVDSAQTVQLPDGSTVRLKRGTTLLYPARFGNRGRDVHLVGEAYFNVRKENGNPFRVHAHGTQVVVKGTTFNLKAYSDRNRIEAVLVTGAIDFVAPGKVVPLTPSQKLVYDTRDDNIEIRVVDVAEELKPNLHIFRSGCLNQALETISRLFGYPIRLEDPSLGRIEISGLVTIDADNSLRHALDILTLTTDTRYRITDNEVVVYR